MESYKYYNLGLELELIQYRRDIQNIKNILSYLLDNQKIKIVVIIYKEILGY